MDVISNSHSYLTVDIESYAFDEINEKPVPTGSALFTLQNIEEFLKKYLSDPVAQQKLEFDPEALKERIQQIKAGYDQKYEQLSWGIQGAFKVVELIYRMVNWLFSFISNTYRFETERVQVDKALMRIDNLFQPPIALPTQQIVEINDEILKLLDFSSLWQFTLVNRAAYRSATFLMLSYAFDCGFPRENPFEAKGFMLRLMAQMCAVAIFEGPRDLPIVDGSTVMDRSTISALALQIPEEVLKELKSAKTYQMLSLFSTKHFYVSRNGFKHPDLCTFFCHVSKDLAKIPDSMRQMGYQALEYAICYNDARIVNLLLLKGIEPRAKHLTMSLDVGKDQSTPEIVRLLLANEVKRGKANAYSIQGIRSRSFEIRRVFYDFDLNYRFGKSCYLVDLLASLCRFENSAINLMSSDEGNSSEELSQVEDLDEAEGNSSEELSKVLDEVKPTAERVLDLEYVLKLAMEKELTLSKIEKKLLATELNDFKPLSLNVSVLEHVFNLRNHSLDRQICKGMQVREDFSDAVSLLLDYGADGNLALEYASAYGHQQIVEMIFKRSGVVNKDALTDLLWFACGAYRARPDQIQPDFSKNLEVIRLLLQCGAEPEVAVDDFISDRFGSSYKTALSIAQWRGLSEIVEVLLMHQKGDLT